MVDASAVPLRPPATYTTPPKVTAAAPESGTGRWPTTVIAPDWVSIRWMAVTAVPPTCSPPNT